MTPRERLLCLLGGDIPDRAPISPFVQEEYLSWYFDKKNCDRLVDAVRLAEALDFDVITRQYLTSMPYFMSVRKANWEVDREENVRDGNFYRAYTIKTPDRVLRQVEGALYNDKILSGIHFSTLEYLIKDADDFAAFRKYLPEMDAGDRNAIIENGRFAKKVIGTRGITCPWAIGGVYNLASTYIDMQNMLMDALTEEDYYAEYMSLFAKLVRENYEIFAESEFDCVGVQGNIANGAIMNGDFFSEHVLPFERDTIATLRQAGKPVIYHNCGNAKALYSCYRDLGITVWETVSPPPQGDNNLEEAKTFFGDRLILSGNFDQVHFLKEASPEEVERAAAECMDIGKRGGHYIFACSDYLETGTPLENVQALLRGARSLAAY